MLYSKYDYDLAMWRSAKKVPSYLVWSILSCNWRSVFKLCGVLFLFLFFWDKSDHTQTRPNQIRPDTKHILETLKPLMIRPLLHFTFSCLFHLLCALNTFSILLQPGSWLISWFLYNSCTIGLSLISPKSHH